MSQSFSRFDSFSYLLAGTATVAALVMTLPAAVMAKTPQEVAEIATPITVQVNSALGDGSGVIIAKSGNTYTVLTVNHVVEKADAEYTIRTHQGKNYKATKVTRLQSNDSDPDLAVIKFNSPDAYPVATLGDSDQAVIGAQIYVFGYPATGGLFGADREPELSPGLVTSRPRNRPEGYNLRYQAVTWSGMSGGPVFDAEARVIGLHGQGEFGFAQTSSGDVAPIKTGFNAAVPINTFITRLSSSGVSRTELQLDSTPTATGPRSSINNPQDSQSYYLRGLTLLDQDDPWAAIADFNRSINLEPTPEAFFNRAIARTLLSRPGEINRGTEPIPDYTEAIQLNSGYADAYYNRALAYLDRAKQYEAINEMQKSRDDIQKAHDDFKKAAELYRQGGRTEAYQDALEKLKQLQ